MNRKRNPAPLPPRSVGRLMSQSAAARAIGVARGTVLAKVAAGELEAENVDGTPVIVRASVERLLARREAEALSA